MAVFTVHVYMLHERYRSVHSVIPGYGNDSSYCGFRTVAQWMSTFRYNMLPPYSQTKLLRPW